MAYKHRRRTINYLVEGGDGKSSVYDELTGRGYSALSTDRLGALHNPGCSRGLNPPVSSSDLAM
jgi:hypothetical protein